MFVTEDDAWAARSGAPVDIEQAIKGVLVRADAFYGLRDWGNALAAFNQVIELRPDHLPAIRARASVSHAWGASPRPFERPTRPSPSTPGWSSRRGAQELATEFAHSLTSRGFALALAGKSDAAAEDDSKAIAIYTRLVSGKGIRSSPGTSPRAWPIAGSRSRGWGVTRPPSRTSTRRSPSTPDWSAGGPPGPRRRARREPGPSRDNARPGGQVRRGRRGRGQGDRHLHPVGRAGGPPGPRQGPGLEPGPSRDALALAGKSDAAAEDDGKAIAIYTRLVEREGHQELAIEFARSLANRGIVLTGMGRHKAAIEDLDKAIAIYTRLVEREGRPDLAGELAVSLAKCGIALQRSSKSDAAAEVEAKAIAIYTRLVEREGRPDLAKDLAESLARRGIRSPWRASPTRPPRSRPRRSPSTRGWLSGKGIRSSPLSSPGAWPIAGSCSTGWGVTRPPSRTSTRPSPSTRGWSSGRAARTSPASSPRAVWTRPTVERPKGVPQGVSYFSEAIRVDDRNASVLQCAGLAPGHLPRCRMSGRQAGNPGRDPRPRAYPIDKPGSARHPRHRPRGGRGLRCRPSGGRPGRWSCSPGIVTPGRDSPPGRSDLARRNRIASRTRDRGGGRVPGVPASMIRTMGIGRSPRESFR